jgi:uncharacterized protein YabN with tetrapyrrole methylase and pyrophosphatase domain
VEVREELSNEPAATAAAGIRDEAQQARLDDELGDLLFAVVNLCRKAGTHPALALDRANVKFAHRFAEVEKLAAERGLKVGEASLAELDALWDEVKARTKP